MPPKSRAKSEEEKGDNGSGPARSVSMEQLQDSLGEKKVDLPLTVSGKNFHLKSNAKEFNS